MERALRGKEIQRKEKNIDIADLSDPNRPTKLAERYGDLYDNEWKDAYETLSSRFHDNEKEVVTKLRDIFKFVFQYCCNLCREQEKDLQRAMMAQHSKVNESIPYFVLNQFKDNRKACSEDFLKSHFRTFQTKYESSPFYARGIDSFVKESFEISWLMNIQDPPIEIDTKTDRHDRFDGTAYKAYTVSGTTIDFVVWPTARVHQGGPILFKGVAQCIPGPTALDILKTGSDEINTTQGRTKQNVFGFNSTGDFQAVKEKDEEIKKLKRELSEKDKTIEQMRQMQGKYTETMKKLLYDKEEELKQIKQMQAKKKKLLNDKEEEIKQIKEDLRKKEKQLYDLSNTEKENAKKLYRVQQDNTKMEEAINSYRMQIATLKEEKDSLLLRLCALAGAKLTDANPDLADLSDENRPTKLAERYSELWDNEWTEAFEYFSINMGFEEEKSTEKLLDILHICYDDCRKRADKDLEDLLRLATDNFCKGDEFPVEMKKTLKDSRKKYHSKIPKDLCKEIDEHLEPLLKYTRPDKVSPYVSTCRSLCWFMAIQDPPVAIERRKNLKPGRKFDKNCYRYYTSSGDHIAYFVWPTLYIHDGGAVLCKGVAQGDKSSAKSPKSHGMETSHGPQNSTASPEPQNSTASPEPQNSTASPEPQNPIASLSMQNSTTSPEPQNSTASPGPQNSKASLGTQNSSTTHCSTASNPRGSAELSKTHHMTTSMPQSLAASPRPHELNPLKQQHDHGTVEQRRAELDPRQSKAVPTQGTRPQSQPIFQKTLQDTTKPNKSSGGHVGLSPVVRSTETSQDKKRNNTSVIKIGKQSTHV